MNEPNEVVEYEVIADFPASMMDVGDKIKVYESTGIAYMVEINDCSEKYDVRDFPHLFQKVKTPEQAQIDAVKKTLKNRIVP